MISSVKAKSNRKDNDVRKRAIMEIIPYLGLYLKVVLKKIRIQS